MPVSIQWLLSVWFGSVLVVIPAWIAGIQMPWTATLDLAVHLVIRSPFDLFLNHEEHEDLMH